MWVFVILIVIILFILINTEKSDPKLNRIKELEKSIENLKKDQIKIARSQGFKTTAEYENHLTRKKIEKKRENYLTIKSLDIDSSEDGKIELWAYNNSTIKLHQIKEITDSVTIRNKFNSPIPKKKIIVKGSIVDQVDDKKYDIEFYQQYFIFSRITFYTEKGYRRTFNINEDGVVNEIDFEMMIIENQQEYQELLNKFVVDGVLNNPLSIDVNLDQKPCLQSLSGINIIKEDVHIHNPFFSDMGDVTSVESLFVSNYENRPPIDLKNLEHVETCLSLEGDIRSFGKLELINGDLDLSKCDFNSYDNLKRIKGDLRIKHQYKGLYNKPIVEGRTYHVRENNLINILEDNWSKHSDSIEKRDFKDIEVLFRKVSGLLLENKFRNAYDTFVKIKYPSNTTFKRKNVYEDYENNIRNPEILRYDGFEIWLLYFYNKNILEINVDFLLKLCGFGKLITDIGKQHIEALMPFIDNEIKIKHPYNLDNLDFNWIEDYFMRFIDHKITGNYEWKTDEDDLKYEKLRIEINQIFEDTIINAENKFRESKGIKRVGEYWKNETELYYKLKEIYPNKEIIQHGSPEWLGEQHLDIYIPEFNIGVEYHGEQHFKPIKVFGGEEGLVKTKERDERKRKLCLENSCHLIEVTKDYNIDDITFKINSLIN